MFETAHNETTLRARQGGFALVELLAAILVLSVGILALLGALTSSRGLTRDSERLETVVHRAQQEIERIEAVPYNQVALSTAPSSSSDPTSPAYLVAQLPQLRDVGPQLERDGVAGDQHSRRNLTRPRKPWNDGRLSGQVYSYVTWATDGSCVPGAPRPNYSASQYSVTINSAGRPLSRFVLSPRSWLTRTRSPPDRSPTAVETPLTDPSTQSQNPQGQLVDCTSGIGTGTANSWFLYDTPATSSSRAAITGDHATDGAPVRARCRAARRPATRCQT